MRFKRNQVEEAISRIGGRNNVGPAVTLRTRLKRLLETDRSLGRVQRASHPERANYAFFSGNAPGSGVEVWFSEYEAFALLTALRLLEHGWPQGAAVSILRQARPRLEATHTEIVRQDRDALFASPPIPEEGALVVSTSSEVFLVIATRMGRPIQRGEDPTRSVEILNHVEVMHFLRSEAGLSISAFGLAKAAHDLRGALTSTTPSKRGRGSS